MKVSWINNVLTVWFTDFNCYIVMITHELLHGYKGVTRVDDSFLLQQEMNTTNTLEIPLSSVGLLLRLLSLAGEWTALVASPAFLICAFLFRTWSTLSLVSLRTKH